VLARDQYHADIFDKVLSNTMILIAGTERADKITVMLPAT
jgi:hypothetical protein